MSLIYFNMHITSIHIFLLRARGETYMLFYSLEIRVYFIESNRTKGSKREREQKEKDISEHKKKERRKRKKKYNLVDFVFITNDLHFTCNTSTHRRARERYQQIDKHCVEEENEDDRMSSVCGIEEQHQKNVYFILFEFFFLFRQ